MRAIIVFFQIVCTLPAAAAAPAPMLEVRVKGHYLNSWSKVYDGAKETRCETDLGLPVELPKNPDFLSLFPKAKGPATECRDRVSATLVQGKRKKSWSGCADDVEVKPFLQALNRACGRSY